MEQILNPRLMDYWRDLRTLYFILQETNVVIFVRIASVRRFLQISTRFVPWSKKTVFHLILTILGFFIQWQIVYKVKMLGNKHCHNEGPLYHSVR